ncbi:MAG: TolC family protein [Archangium sp.]
MLHSPFNPRRRSACQAAFALSAWIGGLLGAAPALAMEPAAPPAMTLRQSLDYAHAHQPELLASRARATAAQFEALLPRAQWLPRLGATAQVLEGTTNNTTTSYLSSPTVDLVRIGGTPSTATGSWAPSPSTLVGVGVRQEVFDFGRISAQSRAADTLASAAQDVTRADLLDLDLSVAEAFLTVRATHSLLEAAEGAVQRATAHRDLARAGVKAGLRGPVELTRAEAELARAEVARDRAQGNLRIAQGLFAAAIGFNGAALEASGEEPSPAELPDTQKALSELEQREPRLRAALSLWRAQQERTQAIGAEMRPDLFFSASVNSRAGGATPSGNAPVPPGGGWLPDVPNWDALLVLNWPLYDPLVSARREASRQQEAVRRAEVDALEERLSVVMRQRLTEAQVARAALPALERSATAAQANLEQAEARFKAGLATSVELADAEALLTEAQNQLALGRFDEARARARLARALSEAL